jgi:hypothetical protein
MIKFAIFFIVMAINVSTIPALASQCASSKEIGASLARWAAIRRQFVNATDHQVACRAFAALFLRIGSYASGGRHLRPRRRP